MSFELPPDPDPAAVERLFGPQVGAAERLLAAAWAERPTGAEVQSQPPEPFKIVVVSIYGRAVSTYRAALHLIRRGDHAQAAMLARSLFEDLIATLWAAHPTNREDVVEAIAAKAEHQRLVDARARNRFAEEYGKATEPVDADLLARAEELDKRFGRSGSRSWFGDLWGATNAVEDY